MNQPASKSDLQHLLISNNIDLTTWGQDNLKSLDNLWQEIQDGESALTENPLRRTIHFVQIIINQQGNILIETAQELANGRTRLRNRPPSEKIQPGETIEQAAQRGLEQELSVPAEQITLLPANYPIHQADHPSASYPGLITCYNIYTVEAAVTGLPQTAFTSQEQSPTDPIRKHFWQWLPEHEARKLYQP